MILLPAGTEDRLRWQGSSERLILSVESSLLEQVANETQTPSPEFAARWSLHDPVLQQILLDLGRQTAEGWPLGRLYADLTATGLAVQLLRRHATNPAAVPEIRGGLPLPHLRHAMEYLTANLDRDIGLEEIASQIHLSPFHFARNFRALTGQTPYQYLLDQRMDRARELLKKSQAWSVQEIASMTGFRSAASFVRAFRQRVGQTPGEWRKDH
jgi:AraC family transcriptional regulator